MSIFGKIKDAIFGKKAQAAPVEAATAAAPAAEAYAAHDAVHPTAHRPQHVAAREAERGEGIGAGEGEMLVCGMSLGFADPAAGFSFGYTMNQMGPGILMNRRGQALVDAAYLSMGFKTKDGGVWVK